MSMQFLICDKYNQINYERKNSYYFCRANQQKAVAKIYSLTQCSLTMNECDWHTLAGNDGRIKSHCLARQWSSMAHLLLYLFTIDVLISESYSEGIHDVPFLKALLHGNRNKTWMEYCKKLLTQCTERHKVIPGLYKFLTIDSMIKQLYECLGIQKRKIYLKSRLTKWRSDRLKIHYLFTFQRK